jgi:putative DNA methylase
MSARETYPKRLIEVDLPIKRISAHARREKSIRHGHISTLHIWWARRPLAACRAVICAALWPDPANELCPPAFLAKARAEMLAWTSHKRQQLLSDASRERFEKARQKPVLFEDAEELRGALLDFIADFANWDNSTVHEFLDTSRTLSRAAHEALGGASDTRPLVVDPFAGGGAIPLEALRVGADAYASDLNPVAVLLNKVLLEYIPRYGQRLADEVHKCAAWIKQEAERELGKFYPSEPDEGVPMAFLWARTVLSESPGEDTAPVEVPLLRSMWLSSKSHRRWALRWVRDARGRVRTEITRVLYSDGVERQVRRPLLEIFQPASSVDVEQGTSKGGAATCPVTGYTTSVERVREQLKPRRGGAADARLLCVVSTPRTATGRVYRLPIQADLTAAAKAYQELTKRIERHSGAVPLLPEGSLNHLRGFFNVVLYGMTTWGDLFAPRQALSLCYLVDLVKNLRSRYDDEDFGNAVQTCLAMALDRCADKCASVVVWNIPGEKVEHVFGRQALPMVWDFAEANILSSVGWSGACEWVQKVIEHNASSDLPVGNATIASATAHPLPDDTADAVVTDPPYYAAIPYADLSDFFYSWLRRSVGAIHGDLFRNPLAPKDDECVQLSHRAAMYRQKDAAWFEHMMTQACAESRRITKPQGIGIFVFANKETSGWEAMLTALITAGWVITGSWPIDTEMGTRLRARNSAALASSVHLVCRPRESPDGSVRRDDIGDWRNVLAELPKRIHDWMPRLAAEGVAGADAIFACLGPALEVFSSYSHVEKASGEVVSLREYLEHVWAAVAKEALVMIFTGADATDFEEDARLTAMWLWTLSAGGSSGSDTIDAEQDEAGEDEEYAGSGKSKVDGFMLEYDAARKIAQGLGVHLEGLSTLIEVKGSSARLLAVGERTRSLFHKGETHSPSGRKMGKKKAGQLTLGLVADLEEAEESSGWGATGAPQRGETVLDRVHQSMILFGAGRSEALKRFLVEDGVGRDDHFWRLAQAFSALYPAGTDEKRWVDGVLARKKSLGF